MIIKKFDFISPKITLYFKGEKVHSSIFSAIVTIIAYLLIFGFMLYYLIRFIIKKDATIYYYNRYVDESESFPLNSSSIFHFIQFFNSRSNQNEQINYNNFRIIGIDRGMDSFKDLGDLSFHNHWVYGPCDYDTDAIGLNDIIDKDLFSQSACIKQYYNHTLKKFFNINEENFIWPTIKNEAPNFNNPERSMYGILIEKCNNDSIKKDCSSIEVINNYIKNYTIALNILDQYADVLNYKKPLVKHLSSMLIDLNFENSLSVNNINFNPTIIKTHSGIIFENIIEEKGFEFIQNEKMMTDSENKNIIIAFYFWMQNTMIYNERIYKKFPDLFSELGGLGSFILMVASFINFIVTHFTILLDTQEIMISINKIHLNKKVDFQLMPIFYRKASEMFYPPKKNNYINKEDNEDNNNISNSSHHQSQTSFNPKFLKEKLENDNRNKSELQHFESFNNSNNKNKKINKESVINNDTSSSKNIILEKRFSIIHKKNLNPNLCKKITPYINQESIGSISLEFKKVETKKSIDKTNIKKTETINKLIKKQNFTLFDYVLYLINPKNKYPKINFYKNFRTHIISEENLIQNYFDIYKLLKVSNVEIINPFSLKNWNKNNF